MQGPNDDTTYNQVDDNDDDEQKHQRAKSPSVLDAEDAFSGSTPSESPDIDEELEKVGLKGDDDQGIKPLGNHTSEDYED